MYQSKFSAMNLTSASSLDNSALIIHVAVVEPAHSSPWIPDRKCYHQYLITERSYYLSSDLPLFMRLISVFELEYIEFPFCLITIHFLVSTVYFPIFLLNHTHHFDSISYSSYFQQCNLFSTIFPSPIPYPHHSDNFNITKTSIKFSYHTLNE